ncbi:Uncharacterized protein OBRU01_08039 [Operophtera brumata]|uniref:DUF4219 domain-containing protein n=1 Tax=Operophtera brumata TaxID=104452 RepID=A0A0L7LH17_OPEBR|nr:Uncharacterized protein OBRU01_08039 [Operophtera brumata]
MQEAIAVPIEKNTTMSHETVISGSSSLPFIEKLDGNTNYSTWKFMMELYLVHDDLWEYTMVSPQEKDTQAGTVNTYRIGRILRIRYIAYLRSRLDVAQTSTPGHPPRGAETRKPPMSRSCQGSANAKPSG